MSDQETYNPEDFQDMSWADLRAQWSASTEELRGLDRGSFALEAALEYRAHLRFEIRRRKAL